MSASAPSAIELFAQRTLDLMPKPSPSKPPGDIILTISVIMVIVKLAIVVYDCWKDNHQITGIVYNPNWIQRLYLRRVVKRVLKDDGQLDKLNDVMSALLKMAKASSQEDIEAIFKEAMADPKIWTTATRLGLV